MATTPSGRMPQATPAPSHRARDPRRVKSAQRGRRAGQACWLTYLLLIGLVLVSVFPFYWSLVIASRDTSQIGRYPPPLTPGDQLWTHVRAAFREGNFALALVNSTIVSGVVTVAVVLTSTMAGFAFAKLSFRGSRGLLAFIAATMLIPTQLGIIPLYIMVTQWFHWAGSLKAVIAPGLVSAFGVFFLTQYLRQALPTELIDAARVDGASVWRTYRSIVLPIARPAAAVLGLLTFVATWNDLFWPLVVLTTENPTVQVAISSLSSGIEVDYALTLTGAVVGTFPILLVFLVFGRQIIGGIMNGAVKG